MSDSSEYFKFLLSFDIKLKEEFSFKISDTNEKFFSKELKIMIVLYYAIYYYYSKLTLKYQNERYYSIYKIYDEDISVWFLYGT